MSGAAPLHVWLCASEVGRDGWNGTTHCRRRFSPVDLSQMVNGVSRSPLKRQVKRDFLFGSVPGAIARKAKDLKPAEVGNFLCSYAALPLPRVSNAERDHMSFFAFKEGTTPTESDAAAPPSLATPEREAGISLEEAADAGLEGDFGAMRVAVGMLALRLGQQAASSFGTPLPDFATEYGDRNPSIAHSLARKAEQRADVAPVTSQAVCNTVYGLARLRAATDEALEEAAVTRARQRAELAMASADFTTSEPDDGSDATTAPGGTCVFACVAVCGWLPHVYRCGSTWSHTTSVCTCACVIVGQTSLCMKSCRTSATTCFAPLEQGVGSRMRRRSASCKHCGYVRATHAATPAVVLVIHS